MLTNLKISSLFLLLFLSMDVMCAVTIDYLNSVCNSDVSITTSRALESHTSLTYGAQMSCYYHVTVPANYVVMAEFKSFQLESKVNNVCADWVDVHDGDSISSSTINPSPLCGTLSQFNYTSTGTDMTLYFETDAIGQRRGFYVIFTAISLPPCSSGWLECGGICVSSYLICDGIDHCADREDETNCQAALGPPGIYTNPDTDVIVAVIVTVVVLLILAAVVGFVLWRYNRWRCFLQQELPKTDIPRPPTTYRNSYPVTKVYYQTKFQKNFRNPERPYGTEWRNDPLQGLKELPPVKTGSANFTETKATNDTKKTSVKDQLSIGQESNTSSI